MLQPITIAWLQNLLDRRRTDAVFFHFLNRELQRTLSAPVRPAAAAKVILAILTCTRGPHFTTMSFLMEGGLGMAPEMGFLGTLINRQMLDVISDSMTLEEHVLSHRRQYSHDESRYPEYFDEKHLARVTFHPTKFKEQDTTEHLSAILQTTFRSQTAVLDLPFPGYARKIFADIRLRALDVLESSEGRGITMSLFQDILSGEERASLPVIGRLLSY